MQQLNHLGCDATESGHMLLQQCTQVLIHSIYTIMDEQHL